MSLSNGRPAAPRDKSLSGSCSNLRSLLTFCYCSLPFLALVAFAACSGSEYPGTTIDSVTSDLGDEVQHLYRIVFWWTMFILALVWALLAWVIIRYKERPGAPEPKKTRGSLAMEIGWTIGPALIVIAITVPTVQAVFRTQAPRRADALAVEVIGHQWWWEYRYPELGLITANELHLPVDRPIRLRLHSADVIHSFWVPRLGGKRDVNPLVRKPEGREPYANALAFTIEEPGEYYGQCAEFCGESHALMGLRVIAQTAAEFDAWAAGMKTYTAPDSATLEGRGAQIFMRSVCIACHAIGGTNAGGVLGPSLTGIGSRTTIAAGQLENSAANLAAWIKDPSAFKPGAKMPGALTAGGNMPATGLSDDEVNAIAAYLWSLE